MNVPDELINLDFVKNTGLKPTLDTIDQITNGLHGDGDCGPVLVTTPDRAYHLVDDQPKSSTQTVLLSLRAQKIIVYKFERSKRTGITSRHPIYKVFIKDRYKFDRFCFELERRAVSSSANLKIPAPKNIVFYNQATGDASVNGNVVHFKKSKRNSTV